MTTEYLFKVFGYLWQYFKQLLLISCVGVLNKSIDRSGLNYQRTFIPIFFLNFSKMRWICSKTSLTSLNLLSLNLRNYW